jgi:hypothetical protein
MWAKVGPSMKTYNDMIPHSTTSTSLDKDTWQLYASRNSPWAGITCPEEDSAPHLLPDTIASTKIKKKYL